MTSRKWVKLHCREWIEGTIRQEEPAIRCVFADLLALAGDGKYGDVGVIKLANGISLSDKQICAILQIKTTLWKKAKTLLLDSKRIEITPQNAIIISNWAKYQSEYQRQKPYRTHKSEDFNEENGEF